MSDPSLRVVDARQFTQGLRADEERARVRARVIDTALQFAIAVLTIAALWLLTSASPSAKYGHWLGLASQPFWIAATWRSRQWGMFLVAVVMVGLWLRGIVNHFF